MTRDRDNLLRGQGLIKQGKGWQTLVPGEMLKVSLRIRAYPLASP